MPKLRSRTFHSLYSVKLAAFAALLTACSGAGSYVWVNELPPDARDARSAGAREYLIAVGDVLNVRVLNQDAVSTRARVRADGRIALPMVGEIDAEGKRPSALRAELEARLKDFIVAPSVTVNVDESQPIQVSALGEVTRPGVLSLDARATVAQALANAGGVTEFADRSRIFVVRAGPTPLRVRFTYESITRGDGRAASFVMRNGDVVVVE